jgi:hypothetical protein
MEKEIEAIKKRLERLESEVLRPSDRAHEIIRLTLAGKKHEAKRLRLQR